MSTVYSVRKEGEGNPRTYFRAALPAICHHNGAGAADEADAVLSQTASLTCRLLDQTSWVPAWMFPVDITSLIYTHMHVIFRLSVRKTFYKVDYNNLEWCLLHIGTIRHGLGGHVLPKFR